MLLFVERIIVRSETFQWLLNTQFDHKVKEQMTHDLLYFAVIALSAE